MKSYKASVTYMERVRTVEIIVESVQAHYPAADSVAAVARSGPDFRTSFLLAVAAFAAVEADSMYYPDSQTSYYHPAAEP